MSFTEGACGGLEGARGGLKGARGGLKGACGGLKVERTSSGSECWGDTLGRTVRELLASGGSPEERGGITPAPGQLE